jgi:hypothetical protein
MKTRILTLGVALVLLGPALSQASSHRHAPILNMLSHFLKHPRAERAASATPSGRERLSVLRTGANVPDFHRVELALR